MPSDTRALFAIGRYLDAIQDPTVRTSAAVQWLSGTAVGIETKGLLAGQHAKSKYGTAHNTVRYSKWLKERFSFDVKYCSAIIP